MRLAAPALLLSRPCRFRVLLGLALLLALLSALPAQATAITWSAHTELTNPLARSAGALVIDANDAGDLVAAWRQTSEADIFSVVKPAAGTPGAPQEFVGTYDEPTVAIGGGGVGLLAFSQSGTDTDAILAASKPGTGAAFTAATPLEGAEEDNGLRSPIVAVSDSGTGFIFYDHDQFCIGVGCYTPVVGRTLANPLTNAWNAGVEVLAQREYRGARDIATAADGSAFLLIKEDVCCNSRSIYGAVLESNGTGSADNGYFATGGGNDTGCLCGGDPHAARTPNGGVIATWFRKDAGIFVADISKSRAKSGSGVVTEVRMDGSDGDQRGHTPRIATDDQGNAIAAWIDAAGTQAVLARYRPAGGSWGPTETVSAGETSFNSFELDMDGIGNGYVVYEADDAIKGAVRRPGAGTGWAGRQLLSTEQAGVENPRVAAAGPHRAFASWTASPGNGVYYASVDATPPTNGGGSQTPPSNQPPAAEEDKRAPAGKVAKKRSSKVGKAIKLRVVSNEDGSALARGTQVQTSAGRATLSVWIAKQGKGKKRRVKRIKVKLKPARKALRAGVAAQLKLKPQGKKNKKLAKRLKKAVKRKGAKARANITVVFRDKAGNKSTKKLKIKLR